jgi:hypothetical protein
MGGMGFIENNKALCMLSVLINTHRLMAAHKHGVDRFFYSSSACVYPGYKQTDADVVALKESDAYPADAEDGYGWEKIVRGAPVPAFPGGLRHQDPRGALSQMSMGRLGPGMVAAKKPPSRYRARWRWL